MNVFEKTAETIGNNYKGFEKRGIKIHRAEGDPENKKQQRQIRLMEDPLHLRSFPCIFLFSCHRFNEINEARP
jgi:hypothetical protein